MSSVGRISLDLSVNNRNFDKQVDGIGKKAKKSFGSMSVAIGNIWAQLAQKAAAAIGNFVSDSISKGSELAELENVVDSVFTTMSDKVDKFSQSALDNYGLTEIHAKKMIGTFGAMSKAFGFSEQQAYDMSASLTGLAGDVASFYNLDIDTAYTKMKSVFTGETEAIKDLGVVMTQAALDEFALANNMGKTTAKMSEQEKVALRLAFVQDRLKTASGDVIRTQDSWANQVRKLSGQIDSFKAAIGQGFINILTPVIKALNIVMAKLIQVANAFKSFTESIMGNKNKGAPGGVMGEVAEAANSAANSTLGIEDAANGAAGAAQKAKKALMGFDEINRLSSTEPDAGELGDVSFGNIDFSGIASAEDITNKVFESIKTKASELIELFKEGFRDGLGDDFETSLIRTSIHFKEIGDALKDIALDTDVMSSFSLMLDSFFKSSGTITGAAASLGASIGENLIGGISKYLEENKGFIKDRLSGIFDSLGGTFESTGNLFDGLAFIGEAFRSDSGKEITSNLVGIFSNAALSISEIALRIGEDTIDMIAKPIIDNKGVIKEALEETFNPINTILATIKQSVDDTFGKFQEVYDEKISPAFQRFGEGLSSITNTIVEAWRTHIVPVLDEIAAKFKDVWEEKVQPAINKVIEVLGKVFELLSKIWQNVLVPLINWIIENIIPVIAPIIKSLIEGIINLFGAISDVVKGIFTVLGGLIDFIIGVFSGDWDRAWNGIKSIFEGIWTAIKGVFDAIWSVIKSIVDAALGSIKATIERIFENIRSFVSRIWTSIKDTFMGIVNSIVNDVSSGFNRLKTGVTTIFNTIKTTITNVFNGIWSFLKGIINTILGGIESMVNGVIKGLNKMISAMNSLSFDVPDWVPELGGQSFGFSIPKLSEVSLPRLAEGGYVRANQPRPVIIGDNKTQGEIVSPEGKMLEIVIQALEQFFSRLKDAGYGSSSNGEVGDIIIPIYLDGTSLDEVIVTAQQRRAIRSGGR